MNLRRPLISLTVMLGLAACSSLGVQSTPAYENKEKSDLYKNGSIIGDKGGYNLLGDNGDHKSADKSGLAVNAYLWRATLDTIAFMPISTTDPFGGVIITDWYSPPAAPNERTRLNVFILGREMRADGVRVTVFRQTKGADGAWADAAVSPATAGKLEEAILTRARQMKMAQRDKQ